MTTRLSERGGIPEGAAGGKGRGCRYCNRERVRQQDAEVMKDAAGPILVLTGLGLGGTVLLMSFVPAWAGMPGYWDSAVPGFSSAVWMAALSVGVLQTLTIGGLGQIRVRRRPVRRLRPF